MPVFELNRVIEHAVLSPTAGEQVIADACQLAQRCRLYGLVVNPGWVEFAARRLADSGVCLVSVAGFPLGASRTETKIVEAVRAAIDGAREIDLVANIGWLVSGEPARAETEIAELRRALPEDVPLKVIIEASQLDPRMQVEAARMVVNAGAQFVKTGTGFFGDATTDVVSRLAEVSGGRIGVKASGGIRTAAQCRAFLAAGATRIGTSASESILSEQHPDRE